MDGNLSLGWRKEESAVVGMPAMMLKNLCWRQAGSFRVRPNQITSAKSFAGPSGLTFSNYAFCAFQGLGGLYLPVLKNKNINVRKIGERLDNLAEEIGHA